MKNQQGLQDNKKGLTRLESVIIILFITFALLIFIPALNRARSIGSRMVCLSNIQTLGMGWIAYAEDNNQNICAATMGGTNNGAPSWGGNLILGDIDIQKYQEEQIKAINKGAIWSYVNNIHYYQCPLGIKGEMVTYSGMDGVNGAAAGIGTGRDELGVFITNKNEIKIPAERIVFLDVGFLVPGSYTVYYDKDQWWDLPTTRHDNGTTYVFADGHTEYYQWEGKQTIELGQNDDSYNFIRTGGNRFVGEKPKTKKDASDLQWLQKGCWGKLGYEPSF